mmetsp:Transcript_24341/g.21275  ORF Transcript_24341/g.21275 Transcript_24341/m.21275 type:complete len:145 (+) Transcript_24341:140-574(+)
MAYSTPKLFYLVYVLLFGLVPVLSQNEPIVQAPIPETPINGEEKPTMTLWELLAPWRGIAMICFWALIIGICASIIIAKYCVKNAPSLSRILKRGKYSKYNFVSVYSETEAEFGQFGGIVTDNDDFDTDKLGQDPVFDEISIIK